MAKDPNVYLAHARDCCLRIGEYVRGDEQLFLTDTKTQDAVLRNLEVIGQCIKDANLAQLESEHPGVPWRDIAAFRNVLAHVYLGIELPIVWDIIKNQLPALHRQLDTILTNWTP